MDDGGTVAQSRLRTPAGPGAVAAVEVAVATLVIAVWAPLVGPVTMPVTVHALTAFAWLAIVTGVGAPLLLFALIRRRGATGASSLLFVVPAVTAIVAWPLLGTPIAPLTVVGLALAGFGLTLVQRGRRSRAAAVVPARTQLIMMRTTGDGRPCVSRSTGAAGS